MNAWLHGLGLVIVAISVSTARILQFQQLPAREAATIASVVLILLASVAGLIPEQSLRVLGIEILVFTAIFWATQVRARNRPGGATAPRHAPS